MYMTTLSQSRRQRFLHCPSLTSCFRHHYAFEAAMGVRGRQSRAHALAAMGLSVDGCVTDKDAQDGCGRDGRLAWGVSAMQGWREEMEDAHLCMPDFDLDRNLSLFGVFDGHGGSAVAKLVAHWLPVILRRVPAFEAGKYEEALRQTFLRVDEHIASVKGRKEVYERSKGETPDCMGCTAIVALLVKGATHTQLLVANAGDSRCVLISGARAVAMSKDHTPTLPEERLRVRKAGGFVNREGRINGNLNLSRALGDLIYKKNKRLKPEEQLISGMPDVSSRSLGHGDRYLLLGCDGIFERMSNQAIADFVVKGLNTRRAGARISSVCSDFLDANVSKNPMRTEGLGCDNMSLLLVDLASSGERAQGDHINGTPNASADNLRTRTQHHDGHTKTTADSEGFLSAQAADLQTVSRFKKRSISFAWLPPFKRRRVMLARAVAAARC